MIARLIFTAIVLLTGFSCRPGPELTEKQRTAVMESVRETLHNYYRDIRTGGLTQEFKYLDNSSEFFWVPPGYSSALSYDSVASIIKVNAPSFRSVENAWDTLKIVPLSGALATYTGRLHSTMTDTSGKVMKLFLVETGILIRRNDGWKLLCGQTAVLP